MNDTTIQPRESKYCDAIRSTVAHFGHATNAQILAKLQEQYPDLSATTVHRATARLASRGEIGVAPADTQGAMRYDSLAEPHDHFMCSSCGNLRNVDVVEEVASVVEEKLDGCEISGRITISGVCKMCHKKEG